MTTTITTPVTTTSHQPRVDIDFHAARFLKTMAALDAVAGRNLDPLLFELVRVHASHINGCAYCIDMHSKDALAKGETVQRLVSLPAWRETGYYTDAERAALALTEAVTLISADGVPDEVYEAAAQHFSDEELAQLIAVIVVINAWNRISITTRGYEPGSYEVAAS
jgi:AhpD family alkylhydroperoxidase